MSVAARLEQGRKFLGGLSTAQRRHALLHGVFADPWHVDTLARLRPGFVVDVGAHHGQFALAALTALPMADVLSFEPQPAACARYRRAITNARAVLRTAAVGATSGVAQLNVSSRSDSSSLLEITDVQTRAFPGTNRRDTIEVPLVTLDQEVEHVAERTMLKLDVQGSEMAVLEGAARVLPQFAWILCEVSFREFYAGQPNASDIIEYLAARGFHLAGIEHVTRVDGVAIQADVIFDRRN